MAHRNAGGWYTVAEAVSAGAAALHVTFVLLGAPLFENCVATAAMALWLSLLTCAPVAWHLGPVAPRWRRVLFLFDYATADERAVAWYTWTVLGAAWASAAVIPLDWDVWWQEWPYPCFAAATASVPVAGLVALCSYKKAATWIRHA